MFSIPNHACSGADHGFEFFRGIVGSGFLNIAEYNAEDHHQQDHDGSAKITG